MTCPDKPCEAATYCADDAMPRDDDDCAGRLRDRDAEEDKADSTSTHWTIRNLDADRIVVACFGNEDKRVRYDQNGERWDANLAGFGGGGGNGGSTRIG